MCKKHVKLLSIYILKIVNAKKYIFGKLVLEGEDEVSNRIENTSIADKNK